MQSNFSVFDAKILDMIEERRMIFADRHDLEELPETNYCSRVAAKIFKLLLGFRSWKFAHGESDWVKASVAWVSEKLIFEHPPKMIRRALNLLVDLGIVDRVLSSEARIEGKGRWKNPALTWFYQIKIDPGDRDKSTQATRDKSTQATRENVPKDLHILPILPNTSKNCVEQNFQNSENTHTEILENSEEDLPGNSGQVEQIINVSTEQTSSTELIKYSGGATATIKYDSRLGMRPPAPKPKYLIPAGDWLNSNGQLNAAFIRHTAKQWQKSSNASFHQLAIEEVEALVFSHFAKNHDALAVKWEAFTKTSVRHAESVKLRLDAGIEIGEAERLEIIGKTQAITSNKSIPLEQLTIGSECEENHQAYKLIESAPINESEQIENLKRLASLSSVIKKMPEAKANMRRANIRRLEAVPADINEANQWILDPALKMAALQWARNQGFSFDGSEIYQEEF